MNCSAVGLDAFNVSVHRGVVESHRERTDEKEMFLDVDEKQAEKEMIGCQVAMSYIVVMQRLEMYVDRQLSAGMVAQAVGATMTIEVGDGRASQRHEPTDSDMMAQDRAARGTP